MNSIEIKVLASLAHPGVFWRFTFSSDGLGQWQTAIDGGAAHNYPTLADLMHSEAVPRSIKGALRDLMQAGNLWPLNSDHSQRWV